MYVFSTSLLFSIFNLYIMICGVSVNNFIYQ